MVIDIMAMRQKTFYDWLMQFGLEKSKVYDLHNRFYSYNGWTKGKTRSNYFSYCQELVECMSEYGATEAEIEIALIFCYVVLDCEKYKLSVLKAKDELNIDELYKKYVLGGLRD